MTADKKFEKMLVAFDGSKDSVKAVSMAVLLAVKFGSEILLVHVYSSSMLGYVTGPGMPVPDFAFLEDAERKRAQDTLIRGVGIAQEGGVRAKGVLLKASSVVQALVEYSSNNNVDLIVVGTRGMTGFRKLLLGSVSGGLVSHASCPLLVVR